MRVNVRKAIPSMFHRRLLLLGIVFAVLLAVGWTRALVLTVVQHDELRQRAERVLDQRTYLPTTRGAILDRHGRKLATDQASYDVAVAYSVVTGEWARQRATTEARRANLATWRDLSLAEREQLVLPYLDRFQHVEQEIWERLRTLGHIDQPELDRRRNFIKGLVERRSAVIWRAQFEREAREYGISEDAFTPMRIAERESAHVILQQVSDEVAFEFMAMAQQWPRGLLEVFDSHERVHPFSSRTYTVDRRTLPRPLRSEQPLLVHVDGIADHLLGSMRGEVWAEDVQRRPFRHPETGEVDLKGYRVGDSVGSTGLERAFEDVLRGQRGVINERRDTGAQRRTEPEPGADVELTIDIELQGRIQAILSHEVGLTRVQDWHENDILPLGFKLNAAAVVMDVRSGEILAMVSMPTLADGAAMTELQRRINMPNVNRVTDAIYPPGSIIKPLVLVAAASDGVHEIAEPIVCNGHFYEQHTHFARCWIYRENYGFRTHGALGASESIARSCNIYFYTLADRLDIYRLTDWLKWFGMGERIDTGLTYEIESEGRTLTVGGSAGSMPSAADIDAMQSEGSLRSATIFMGIGQGPITWTPLHAANAYALLARRGEMRDAKLIRQHQAEAPVSARSSRRLDPAIITAAMEGLRQSAEELFGTSNHLTFADQTTEPIITAPGVTVWAKTGTAQAPRLPYDIDGDGAIAETYDEQSGALLNYEGISGLSHAWFTGLVGPKGGEPRYSIAVIVEYAGSGGRVAGPIANQIIHILQQLDYLPSGSQMQDANRF